MRPAGAIPIKSIKGHVGKSDHWHNERELNPSSVCHESLKGGIRATPRMAMIRSDDAWPFNGPRPSMAREKMFDHITEQNSPTPRTAHLAVSPALVTPTNKRAMIST